MEGEMFIQQGWYLSSWSTGSARSQGIGTHGINLVIQKYSGIAPEGLWYYLIELRIIKYIGGSCFFNFKYILLNCLTQYAIVIWNCMQQPASLEGPFTPIVSKLTKIVGKINIKQTCFVLIEYNFDWEFGITDLNSTCSRLWPSHGKHCVVIKEVSKYRRYSYCYKCWLSCTDWILCFVLFQTHHEYLLLRWVLRDNDSPIAIFFSIQNRLQIMHPCN